LAPAYLAYHPAGNRLAVSGKGGGIEVWEAATGNLVWKASSPPSGYGGVAWRAGGPLLAAGCKDADVPLSDGAKGTPRPGLRGHQNSGITVAFAAGGDLLVSSAWDGSSRLWDPWTGHELLRLTGDARYVSRDGRRLASRAGHTLTVWEVAPGREYLPLPGN